MTTTTNSFTTSGGAAYMPNRMDWETPTNLFASLDDDEFHFTLDAASSETVFCNPPSGRAIADWVRKCSMEASRKNTLVVMLLPARTDTKWLQDHILNRAEVRFLKGRLKFETDGVPDGPAPFPNMIVVMRTGER